MKKTISLILFSCILHADITFAQESGLLGADAALKIIYGEQTPLDKNHDEPEH